MENVTVIIPTYNRASIVGRAVESALAATRAGDEIIVVDDGSTDNTAEVLRRYGAKIRHVSTQVSEDPRSRNMGTGAGRARNLGIRLATRPLVSFLDDDDEWFQDTLELQRVVMDAYPEVILAFTDLISRRENGEIVHNILDVWRGQTGVGYSGAARLTETLGAGVPFSSIATLPVGRSDFNVYVGDLYKTTMEVYCVWTCAVMVRREAAGEALKFAEDLHLCEEWECFANLAKLGPAAYLDCELAVQNLHGGVRNTDVGVRQLVTDRIKLLHRVWGRDGEFLEVHGEGYQDVLRAQHLDKAKYLIREGRCREAKDELRVAGGAPWSYRLLSNMPSPLVSATLSVRRTLRRLSRSR